MIKPDSIFKDLYHAVENFPLRRFDDTYIPYNISKLCERRQISGAFACSYRLLQRVKLNERHALIHARFVDL